MITKIQNKTKQRNKNKHHKTRRKKQREKNKRIKQELKDKSHILKNPTYLQLCHSPHSINTFPILSFHFTKKFQTFSN